MGTWQGMKKFTPKIFLITIIGLSVFWNTARSISYQWVGATSNWASATNWTPNGVPSSADSVSFGASGSTSVINAGSVAGITFPVGAQAYDFSFLPSATIGSTGGGTNAIFNQSDSAQSMQFNGEYTFQGNVTGSINFSLAGPSTFSSNKTSDATISANVDTAGNQVTFQNTGTPSTTATFSGQVTGGGSVVAEGPVMLSNTSSNYTGGATVSGGASVVSPYANLSLSGGRIQVYSASHSFGTWTSFNNGITHNGLISVSGPNNILQLVGGGAILFNVSITDGTSPGDLTIGAASYMAFNYMSTYSGETKIQSGASLVPWSGFLGDKIPNSSGLTLEGGGAKFVGDGDGGTYTYTKPMTLLADTLNSNLNTIYNGGINPLTLTGLISGAGGLAIGQGVFVLSNPDNDYTGGTQINSGTTLRTTTTSVPEAGGMTLAGGSLAFTDSEASTYAGNMSLSDETTSTITSVHEVSLPGALTGGGGLIVGEGDFSFSNTGNSYTGGTQVNSGATLRTLTASLPAAGGVTLEGGSLSFTDSMPSTYAGDMNLSSETTSTISAAEAVSLSGAITGAGGVTIGRGKVILSGTSNTYSGVTSIAEGATFSLSHRNSFPHNNNIHLEKGVLNLSSITPANAGVHVGILSTDTGHGTFKIPVDSQGNATPLIFDTSLDLTGKAFSIDIFGTTPAAGNVYATGDGSPSYVVMQGVSGSPDAMTLNLSGALSSHVGKLSVSGSDLLFRLLGYSPSASSPAVVGAGQSSAQLNSHFTVSNITSSIMGAIRSEAGGQSTGGIGSSGGYGEDVASFSLTNNPFQAPPFSDSRSFKMTEEGMREKVVENRKRFRSKRGDINIWFQPFGSVLRQDPMYGNLGVTAQTWGGIFGADHNVNGELSVGAGIGYANTDLGFDLGGGKGRIKERFITMFGTWAREGFHVDLSLVGGLQKSKGYRTISGSSLRANNQHDGYQFTPSLGGGYQFLIEGYQAEVFAGFSYAFSHQGKYQETGAGTADLTVTGTNASMLRSEGGGRISTTYDYEAGRLKIGAKLGMVNKMPIQKGNIVTANAGTFETTTKPQNYLSPGVDGKFEWDNGFSAGFSYNSELGSKYVANEVLLTLKKRLGGR